MPVTVDLVAVKLEVLVEIYFETNGTVIYVMRQLHNRGLIMALPKSAWTRSCGTAC